MKVVINNCYGGFGLSKEAYEWLKISCSELYGTYHCADDLNMDSKEFRSDAALVTPRIVTGKQIGRAHV